MKGLPKSPDGEMGPWYQRVNSLVRQAQRCTSRTDLEELLGPPDHVLGTDEALAPFSFLEQAGSMLAPVREGVSAMLLWRDPYRRRFTYCFSVGDDGSIVQMMKVADSPHI